MKLIPPHPSFLLLSNFLLSKNLFTSAFRIYLIEAIRGDIGYFSFSLFTNFSQEEPDGFKLEEAFNSGLITHNKQSKTMKWKHAREPGKHARVYWPQPHIATTRHSCVVYMQDQMTLWTNCFLLLLFLWYCSNFVFGHTFIISHYVLIWQRHGI